MKKVLIADDEFLVRLGLKTTIDWPQYGYNIVGEASNGQEALQMFDKFAPDILMTDIKMPGMDGLELISQVKQKNKNTQVIILSNYRDFDYACQAIQFGVSQYLIKSEINEKKLLDALNTLSIKYKNQQKLLPDSINDQKEYIRSQVLNLHSLPTGILTAPKQDLFPESAYVILDCSCDVFQLAANTVDILTDMLSSLVDLHFHHAVYSITKLKYIISMYIIAPVSHITTNATDCLTAQGKMLARNIKQYSNVNLLIGISSSGNSQRFPDMFAEAKLAKQNCFFISDPISVFCPKLDSSHLKPPKISFITIKGFIDNNNRDGLKQYIADIFSRLHTIGDYKCLKNCFIDFLAIAKSIYEEFSVNKESLPTTQFDYENLTVMSSISIAEKHILNLFEEIFDMLQNTDCGYSYFIKVCLSFIASHYSDNITLSDAAKAANVSSSYLSLIFKQEMGINFSNYLTQYRIEQAEKLLTTTDLRIYEIAEKVGFSSPYYFSRVFKDITNMTCKEYKDRFFKA